jgi:chromosome segregation ATPase
MAKPISFRPTQENLEILNQTSLDKSEFINRSIKCYLPNVEKIKELERVNRSNEQLQTVNDFSISGVFEENRKAQEELESQLKIAKTKIEELESQSVKYQGDIEILKSEKAFLSKQTSELDKTTLNELATLRMKVVEQTKEVSSLKEQVASYENSFLRKAFEKFKGTKQEIESKGTTKTFTINNMAELVKALSYRCYLHLVE